LEEEVVDCIEGFLLDLLVLPLQLLFLQHDELGTSWRKKVEFLR
jgi:hypothetical protein